jgi:hypothetical protein
LAHADVEGDAGSRGGFLEDHREHLAGERLGFRAGLAGGLTRVRIVHDDAKVAFRYGGKIEKMLGHDVSCLSRDPLRLQRLSRAMTTRGCRLTRPWRR